MSLVHVLLCHSDAAMVGDLFRFLYRSEDRFLIHVDAKAPVALHHFVRDLARRFRTVRVLPPLTCSWGGYSLVAATVEGIRQAARLAGWEHLVLLTEQHLPLLPPGEIAMRLRPGVSHIEAVKVATFGPEVRAGVRHRYAWDYRELPGVGGFATTPRALAPDWPDHHWLGSQCIVLARDACQRLASPRAGELLASRFAGAVMTDESALQTLLLGTALGAGLNIRGDNPTWVAAPHRGGTDDAVLTDKALALADAHRSLFIRKRPAVLPNELRAKLESWAVLAPDALPLVTVTPPASRRAAVEALAGRLATGLAPNWPSGAFELLLPEHLSNCPTCYLRVRLPNTRAGTTVSLVSHDMVHFKVVLSADARVPVPAGVAFYPMAIRVHDMFAAHEWQVPSAVDHGFVTLAPGEAPDRLGSALDSALRFVASLDAV